MVVKADTLNVTDIWKEISNIGYTTFVNVADGTQRTVAWGHLQWLGFAGSIAFPVILAAMAIKFIAR